MCKSFLAGAVTFFCAALVVEGPAWCQEAPDTAAAEESAETFVPQWQIFFAAANVQPKLDESEGKIDRLINNGIGRLFPRWDEPTTFKDWQHDMKLWDFQIGVGRDISPKLTWYVSAGGTYGLQPNNDWYFLYVLPVDVEVDFERSLWFIGTGIDYYFLGRPELAPAEEGKGYLSRMFSGTRPYLEAATGYVNIKCSANTNFNLPFKDGFIHYQDKARYDLIYVSPRIGVEMPVSQKDSVALAVGPLFFTSHTEEFNNVSIYTVYRHKF